MADPLLRLDGISAGHGAALAIHEVSLEVAEGEALALLGRNGAGKTTLIATAMGAARLFRGRLWFAGQEITRLPSERRAALGLGWVPQERNVFRSLTVEENLTAVARPGGPWTLRRVYELFPRLEERRRTLGSALSGGEQQMLAMGRALMLNPRLLLLDEPLEGLAPVTAQGLLGAIQRMTRAEGMAAIIVEQHARQILPITDRVAILERGRLVHLGASEALLRAPAIAERYLGVAAAVVPASVPPG
ncbi:MAG: ABC transporter ATP-binding protein [Acetobacteraceae bacterium]|nr:ABC transporter ATP-binding protein [Acetobacteraceae bacterium]